MDIKEYASERAKKKVCEICGREARIEIDEEFYCWEHGAREARK